ncbi:transporter substrate-binding domain-containing protein [Piscinibacter sp. XHJ-5]|uniref:substrate-binding periplasmic protein n=1 Tax=Piscinibacter sp. XHJ-5 TaxID=3037797 RepID=UPI0024530F9D|nr:transporter substrate-binding domain-containing protein [Piscinibacter sp. XHJ-5]
MKRRLCLAALAAAVAAPASRAEALSGLARVRQRGSLVVGLYHDMPPFHVKGEGIDVQLARALAAQLEVGVSLLPFHADESVADDLRHVVWRGHYLGWGPADVLMHVPVERALMDANPRVRVLAPYYREKVAIARRLDALPVLDSLAALRGRPVAVAGQSLAGWLLIGADGGALRDTLLTHWPDGVAAARALRQGEVVAAAGLASELESVLGADARFAIEPLPAPRAPSEGWAIGCAVKKDAVDLAEALQRAMQSLQGSGQLAAMFQSAGVPWRL